MNDLITRPYRPGDAAALTDLLNAIDVAAGADAAYVVGDVASVMATVVRDLTRDTRLVFTDAGVDAGAGTLVAAAAVPTPPAGGFRVDLEGGVHPEWQGRGLGRDLFAWQLERAREIHADAAPDRPWEIHASAMLDNRTAVRLFERFGLTPGRYWFDMVARMPLAAKPVALPAGLVVETYSAALARTVHTAHMEAFQDHWGFQYRGWDEWAPMTVESETLRPDLSVLAMAGDEIAGYVLNYRDPDPERLYVGHVGVRRPWRRQGVAAALLTEVLTRATAAGYTSASLGVDADSPTGAGGVYERVGFRYEHRAVTYLSPLPGA